MSSSKSQYGQRVYQGILPPWWDEIDITYPDAVTEIYTYSSEDDEGVSIIQAIISVTYTDSSKSNILKVKKTYNAPTAY